MTSSSLISGVTTATAIPAKTASTPTSTAQAAGNLMKVAGAKGVTMEKIDAVSKDFEAQFLSQMLESMFSTVDTKQALGGSEAEDTYRSMMVTEYGKAISRAGGIGIAAQIKRSMLHMQEVKPS